jgi:hypothetical protein
VGNYFRPFNSFNFHIIRILDLLGGPGVVSALALFVAAVFVGNRLHRICRSERSIFLYVPRATGLLIALFAEVAGRMIAIATAEVYGHVVTINDSREARMLRACCTFDCIWAAQVGAKPMVNGFVWIFAFCPEAIS